MVHEEPLNFVPTPERGIRFKGDGLSFQGIFSVVQADVEFPECEDLRKVLVEEFSSQFLPVKSLGRWITPSKDPKI